MCICWDINQIIKMHGTNVKIKKKRLPSIIKIKLRWNFSPNPILHLTFCWPCIMQWFLVIVQLDAQILFNVFIYLFIVLYMFRACHAHHQEKQIVSIQLLVIVTRCWWQCRVLVDTRHRHQHGVTITRNCIDTICFSWWWAWHARNM